MLDLIVERNGVMYRPCEKCGKAAKDRHHIIYKVYNTTNLHISFLCRKCHKFITAVNTKYSSLIKEKLTDLKRLYIWGQFIQDKIHYSWGI